jgi:hypothetical protein
VWVQRNAESRGSVIDPADTSPSTCYAILFLPCISSSRSKFQTARVHHLPLVLPFVPHSSTPFASSGKRFP